MVIVMFCGYSEMGIAPLALVLSTRPRRVRPRLVEFGFGSFLCYEEQENGCLVRGDFDPNWYTCMRVGCMVASDSLVLGFCLCEKICMGLLIRDLVLASWC
jgi:hypothetical protein